MSVSERIQLRVVRGFFGVALGGALIAAALAARWTPMNVDGPRPHIQGSPFSSLDWPAVPQISGMDLRVLAARPGEISTVQGATSETPAGHERYRLAGTLLMQYEEAESEVRSRYGRAIVDDLTDRRQYVLAEGERVGDLQVLRIERDRAVVQIGGEVRVLEMSFRGGVGGQSASTSSAVSPVVAAAEAMPALEENRFGRRVMPDRWLIHREAVMDYYREIRDDPRRVALLYESFEPVYADGKIQGYRLNIRGEREFLESVGLRAGDVVRAVNSMNMTSRSRAEFFIGEFLKSQLNAVVLDIERDGRPQKLVYLVR